MSVYKIFFTKKSEKDLTHLASYDAKHILRRLQQLDVSFPTNFDIRKMTGTPGYYRLRSGSVRALFEILKNKHDIWVRKIDYRGNIY